MERRKRVKSKCVYAHATDTEMMVLCIFTVCS